MADNVCLVVFFNHRFEANIPKIYKYYGENFKNIRIIIPFFSSSDDDRVITVYENSYNFQGFFAQAYPKLKAGDFSHYVFLGDDCILNNVLNQSNILGALNQDQTSSFISSIETLTSGSLSWSNFNEHMMGFLTPGVEFKSEIPDPVMAVKLFKRHNIFTSTEFSSFINFKSITRLSTLIKRICEAASREIFKEEIELSNKYFPKTEMQLPYPLLKGYSDFLVVNAHDLQYFCHLCGIFASMRMFAEIAIPTALALANSHIVTVKDVDFTVKAFWGDKRSTDLEDLKKECQGSVNNLFSGDRNKMLYYHPIKLSSWRVE